MPCSRRWIFTSGHEWLRLLRIVREVRPDDEGKDENQSLLQAQLFLPLTLLQTRHLAQVQGSQQTIFFIPQKVSKNGTNFTVTKVRHWIDNQTVSDFCNSSEEPTLHDANRTELKRLRLLTKRLDAQHIEYKSIHTYSHIQNLTLKTQNKKFLHGLITLQNPHT